MRLCHEVIDQMLELIPSDQTELIEALKWNREDSVYKAPEETIQWFRTGETLEKYVLILKEDWQFEIASIFSTRSVEELKQMFKIFEV